MLDSIEDLQRAGFRGFESVKSLRESRLVAVPSSPGVYLVLCLARLQSLLPRSQAGWYKDTNPDCVAPPTFNQSTWTPAALNPGGMFTGRKAQLQVAYGTDPLAHGFGFDFDQVLLTNFDLQIPDAQACMIKARRRR